MIQIRDCPESKPHFLRRKSNAPTDIFCCTSIAMAKRFLSSFGTESKGYANIVPDYLITNEPAFAAKENLGIVQVSRPFGARRSARRLVSTLPFDAIVLWTRDTLTYD